MITAQEAQAIGVEAYLYFYPLLSMDVTRRVFTNVPPGKVPGSGPHNTFNSFAEYPAGDFKTVVRANFDTLLFHRLSRHDQRTNGRVRA